MSSHPTDAPPPSSVPPPSAPPPVPQPAAPSEDSAATSAPPQDSAAVSGGSTTIEVPHLSFPVAGIGASAGGLEALEALVGRLSAARMAFIVVQHQAPGRTSMLPDILSRATPLPVVAIEPGMRLHPGVIHVAPATSALTLDGDALKIDPRPDTTAPHQGIDAFLRSLALAAGPMAIGAILSGSGTDGTLGLKAIKDEGGITFAQDPSTAAHPAMPQNAIDSGCADFILGPAQIGEELMRLATHPYVGRARTPQLVDRDAMAKVFARLRSAFGVDFAQYKPSTIERRLVRRMALHRLVQLDDYVALLASDGAELRGLYGDLLIGVTRFFRDAEPFEALKTIVFPRMFEQRSPDRPVRLWVAGCATGEEAYSVAITLLEHLGDQAGRYRIQIFATDIDDEALARARAGIYPQNIELDVSPERLQRFFVRADKGYQVARRVRDMLVFARHNLGHDPPFSRLDLVTCRNVLIYMQAPLQRRVLRIFHYALNPDGYLLLGTSESSGDVELFSLIDRRLKVYAKKNTAPQAVFEFSIGHGADDEHPTPTPAEPARHVIGVTQIADRKVIEKYVPPGVIVDDRMQVLQFRGKTGAFLEPAPGMATLDLLKLARPELLPALRTVVARAVADGQAVTSPPVVLAGDHGARSLALDAIPLPEVGGRPCLLVLFRELPRAPEAPPEAAPGSAPAAAQPRVRELERELSATKEYLQSTIEELEAANEELQSANEELQSSNEELQSTNEELETSKEELQSTNEELATVNDELQSRMSQLSVVNDDLQNVLVNTGSVILIIGSDLRIHRFSASAQKLLSLIPGDVGRPIQYLRNVVSAGPIEQLAHEVIASATPREQRVRCIDGAWYAMRMVPYVTTEHVVRGLVMEMTKTTPPTASGTEGDAVPPLSRQILSSLPQPLVLLDRAGRLAWANRAFFEAFTVSPDALGRPLAEAWGSPTEPPELWAFLDDLLAGKSPRDVLVEHPFGRAADRPMRLTGRFITGEGEGPTLAMVMMQDV